MAAAHTRLAGSGRARQGDAERVADVDPASAIEVTVTVRRPPLPEVGPPLPRELFEREHAARPQDLGRVERVLGGFGLTVTRASATTASLEVSGTAAQIEAAFRPALGVYRSPGRGEFRGREGEVRVPRALAGIVTGVFGLDHRRVAGRKASAHAPVAPPGAPAMDPLGPAELEERYRFPPGDGQGQTIAIAEFGGGYFPDDVRRYCRRYRRPLPRIEVTAVGRRPLTPAQIKRLSAARQADALGESHEVMMDLEIVAGLCGRATIHLLCAPFHEKGWIDLLDRVIEMEPTPVTLSVSWGLAEDAPDWSPAAVRAIDDRLRALAVLGVTVCAATGDDGAGDQIDDGRAHVHFPAASPFVLAVGGTMVQGKREVTWWNAPGDRSEPRGGSTGGGVSALFERPSWQRVKRVRSLNPQSIDGRIAPDVAALAGLPGYRLVFDGKATLNGGTSAAAPLWAALIARIVAASSRPAPGFFAPLLYRRGPDRRVRGRSAFVDITEGENRSPHPGRGYRARRDYDAVTGWGVPNGEALVRSLRA